MDMSEEDMTRSQAIQVKVCPLCSTPIRTCLRYSKVINQQLQDIDKVKREMWRKINKGGNQGLQKKRHDLAKRLADLERKCSAEELQKHSTVSLKRAVDKLVDAERNELMVSLTANELYVALIENKVMLMERLCFISEKMRIDLRNLPMEICKEYHLESHQVEIELYFLERRFMSSSVTQRELHDINTEFSRLNLLLDFCLLSHDIKKSRAVEVDEPSSQMMTAIQESLFCGKRIADEELEKLMKNIATIRRAHPSLNPVTPEEKKEIVSAIGLAKGRWFKCPKGHFYCIGECGGAMERGTCPECGAVIGGANHRLEDGNELAPEMDGANHPAWSEQANLQNYENLHEML